MPLNGFKFTSPEHNLSCSCKGIYRAIFTTLAWLNLIKKQYSLERASIPRTCSKLKYIQKHRVDVFLAWLQSCLLWRFVQQADISPAYVQYVCWTEGALREEGQWRLASLVSACRTAQTACHHTFRDAHCAKDTQTQMLRFAVLLWEILTVVVKWQYMFCFVMVSVPFWFL